MKIKFSDIQKELHTKIEESLRKNPISVEDGFSLIEGFMSLTLWKSSIYEETNIGLVPAVGIVGNTSGRIYNFALKSLLPNVEI